MWFHIVEQRIEEAVRDGVFDDLPGRGRPLQLEDLSLVPDELRAGYILLRTHGYLPAELEARKEWLRLADLLAACVDADERALLLPQVRRAALQCQVMMDEHRRADG
jgi:hypothetical protein